MALPVLRTTVDHVRQLEFKLSEMRAELAAEPDLSGYDVAIATPRWRPWMILGVVLLVVGRWVLRHLRFVGSSLIVGLGLAVVLAVVGGFAIWRSVGMRRQLSDIRMQNELRESEIARRLAGRTDLAERVRQAEQERAAALATIGTADLARAESHPRCRDGPRRAGRRSQGRVPRNDGRPKSR